MKTGSQHLSTALRELCTRFVPTFRSFTIVQGVDCGWGSVPPSAQPLKSCLNLFHLLSTDMKWADQNSLQSCPHVTRYLRVYCVSRYISSPRYNRSPSILTPIRQVWPDYRTPKLSRNSMDWWVFHDSSFGSTTFDTLVCSDDVFRGAFR
jgi:hypothetical protein